MEEWTIAILDTNSPLLQILSANERPKVGHFAAIVLETIWRIRNNVRLGGVAPNWAQLLPHVMQLTDRYWKAAQKMMTIRRKLSQIAAWTPPLLGELKFNVDASFVLNKSYVGIVL